MGFQDIDTPTLRAVIAKLPEVFVTKDVSEHEEMQEPHAYIIKERNYHAFVGKALKRLRDEKGNLMLEQIKTRTKRGSRWRRRPGAMAETTTECVSSEAVATPEPRAASSSGESADLGPQCPSDAAFKARMRRHQSWYRAYVLGVPCGVGPKQNSTKHYGNMLQPEHGEAGRNFLTPGIFRVAKERLAQRSGVIERYRLLQNMLSSQPMCFNLIGPLATDLNLAATLMRALLPGEVEKVEQVAIEWAPQPASKYLSDRTAFDAFIAYTRPDGRRAFLGIETKLTEIFSPRKYDGPPYSRWMRGTESPWRFEKEGQVSDIVHNQLWRDHLLAIALRDHSDSPFAAGRLALVRHPGDTDCVRVVEGYRDLLKTGDDSFLDLPLDRLVATWRDAAPDDGTMRWLDEFKLRYLDLERSGD